MKKILFLLFCVAPLIATAKDWSIEVRGGYFRFNDEVARKIYNNGGMDYELEIATSLRSCLWLWANGNYFTKDGHSIGLDEDTSIHLSTVSAGLKYLQPIFCDTSLYLGVGGSYAFWRGKDHFAQEVPGDENAFIVENTSKNGLGFVAKSGFIYDINSCFFLDLFVDWYYQPMRERLPPQVISEKADLGGFRFGAGIGYAF